MQLSGLKSPPYFEERSESMEPGSRSRHAALGMYLPSICTNEEKRLRYVLTIQFQITKPRGKPRKVEDAHR